MGAETKRQRPRRRVVPWLILVVLLIGGGVAGWWWFSEGRYVRSTDDAYVEADLVPISAKVSGYVKNVLVDDNEAVRAGQALVRIDDADYQARIVEAEAKVASAAAQAETINRQIAAQDSQIRRAEAGLRAAEADATQAAATYQRAFRLAGNSWATKQSLDDARAARDRTLAAKAMAEADLAGAKAALDVLRAQAAEAEAAVGEAKAARDVAAVDLDATVIESPVDGVVGNRSVRPGAYARPGSPLLTLVPLPQVHVVANFKETEIGDVRPGQPVMISVDAWPDATIQGWVESLAPASGAQFSLLPPENATGNFTKVTQRLPVRIRLDPDNALKGYLRPGLSVVAELDTREGGDGRLMPGGVFGAFEPGAKPTPGRGGVVADGALAAE